MRTAASDGKRRAAMKEMPLNIGFVEVRGDGGRCRVKGGEGGVGALGEIRTPDPRNRNPMLYPAELRAPAEARYQTWPDRASIGSLVTGVPPAVLANIGPCALAAENGGGAVVIGEGAGLQP